MQHSSSTGRLKLAPITGHASGDGESKRSYEAQGGRASPARTSGAQANGAADGGEAKGAPRLGKARRPEDLHAELKRLVHNSDEEELEAKLKEAIMCNEYVKRIEAKLEHEFFPDPGSLVPPVDVLSSELRRSRTMGSEPTPNLCLDLDHAVMGSLPGNNSLLLYAILHRSKDSVRKLVAFYPAPTTHKLVTASVCVTNVAHCPVLFKAAIMWGDPDVFRWLLNARQGIIITCQGHRVTWANRVNLELHGLDSLLFGVCSRKVEMSDFVRSLVTAKAEVAGVEGKSDLPIHAAARNGHTAVVKVLLVNGANVNAANARGQTPLHLAFRFGHKATADVLLDYGASTHSTDSRGRSPLHYAYEELGNIHEAVKWLVEKTGSPVKYDGPTQLNDDGSMRANLLGDIDVGAVKSEYGEPLRQHKLPFPEETYVPEERAAALVEFNQDHFMRCWLLPKFDLVGSRDPSAIAALLRDILESERRRLSLVVDLAVRVGADLTDVDNDNKVCFNETAMEQWYEQMEPHLATEAWTNVATGYQSHLFQDARTQLAVRRRWEKDIQGKVYFRLCLWVVFICLVMVVAVWQTGRDGHYARSFQAGFEETILFDEYGAHHSGFWDMRNDGELWEWLTEVFGPNVYEGRGQYRGPEGSGDAEDDPFDHGAIYMFNYLVGRPRIRTQRSKPIECDRGELLKAYNQTLCFEQVQNSDQATAPWTTGSLTWEWHPADVPAFQALTEKYDGSGYSKLMPPTQAEWEAMATEMMDNGFIDMHTRFVIVELTLYNPSHNMFLTARMGTEFTAGGAVIPVAIVDSLKLIAYQSSTDDLRFVFEFAAFIMMCYFIFRELKDMTQPWPRMKSDNGYLPVPTLKIRCRFFKCKKDKKSDVREVLRSFRDAANESGSENGSARRLRSESRSWARRGTHHVGAVGKSALGVASVGAKALRNTICNMSCCGYKVEFGSMVLDTHVAYRPYFFNPFNLLDLAMMGVFAALIVTHAVAVSEAERVDWGNIDGFVNTFRLASLVRAKVYLLACTVFIVWIKTLEHLRVNSSLSTFILIIKGMLGKLGSFFIILAFSLIAFAGLEYIAFGFQLDDISTLNLSLIRGFQGALGDVDMTRNFYMARYVAPLFTLTFAIFVLILLFNLLIAVMSEGYEDIKDKAEATWCFTQFQMIDEQKKAKEYQEEMAAKFREEMTEGNARRINMVKDFAKKCCCCCCDTRTKTVPAGAGGATMMAGAGQSAGGAASGNGMYNA